ncbi:1977_t:CDS:2, partial [Scutellospora calospora]
IAANYLMRKASDLVTAVNECYHDLIVYLVTAISAKDLLQEIKLMYSPNILISNVYYASVLFRYENEFAVKFHNVSILVFLDNKHRYKIGEPGYPVAAVDRGKQVIVEKDTKFVVNDYDFTKTRIIPNVTMLYNIPEKIDGDFYTRKVNICLKELIFQLSSSL